MVLDVYSRRGCHLCELLIEQLDELCHRTLEYRIHDVDSRDDWRKRYGDDVPVVEYAGRRLCQHRLDREAILAVLAKPA